MGADAGACVEGELLAEGGVCRDAGDGIGDLLDHRTGGLHGNFDAAVVGDNHARASAIGDDGDASGEHGFHEGESGAVAQAGQQVEIGLLQGAGVIGSPEALDEAYLSLEVAPGGEGSQAGHFGSASGERVFERREAVLF